MTTLLDHIDGRAATDAQPATADVTAPARRLRATMAAVRLAFTWLGTQKSLTPEQRAQAAEAFDAEGQFLSAGKKLLDVKHPAFRAVTAVRGKIQAYWKGDLAALPRAGHPPDPPGQGRGVRRSRWPTSASSWTTPWPNLDRHYGELKRAAAERLGLAATTRPTTRRRWSACSPSPGTSPPSSRPTT